MIRRNNNSSSNSLSPITVQIPSSAYENWPLFIEECEKVLQIQRSIGGKVSCKKEWEGLYEAIIAGESVTVEIPTNDFNEGIELVMVEFDSRNRRLHQPLASFTKDDPKGTLTVVYKCRGLLNRFNKNGDEIPYKDKNQYLKSFATLLTDMGYEDLTDFGFAAGATSCQAESQDPPVHKQETASTEADAKGAIAAFDDILQEIVVPLKVEIPANVPKNLSFEERMERGLVSLPEYLGYLGKEGRNEYIGNLHRLISKLEDYLGKVTNMSEDLDGTPDSQASQEEMIATMMKCGYTEEQIKAVLEQIGQPLKEDKPDQEPKKDEDEDDIFLPKPKADPEDTVLRPAQKYVDLLTERDDVSNKDIPKKLSGWARDGLSVTRLQVNAALKGANTRYISGGQQGKPVQFLASKPKGKK